MYIKATNLRCTLLIRDIEFDHRQQSGFLMTWVICYYSMMFFAIILYDRERGGPVVEGRTPNREVLGSIPTRVTVLCS